MHCGFQLLPIIYKKNANLVFLTTLYNFLLLITDFLKHISLKAKYSTARCKIHIFEETLSKVKVKVGYLLYSASYTSQTRDQKRFTISEVAADWHELMIPQRTMRPSIARVSEQLDPRLQL